MGGLSGGLTITLCRQDQGLEMYQTFNFFLMVFQNVAMHILNSYMQNDLVLTVKKSKEVHVWNILI